MKLIFGWLVAQLVLTGGMVFSLCLLIDLLNPTTYFYSALTLWAPAWLIVEHLLLIIAGFRILRRLHKYRFKKEVN